MTLSLYDYCISQGYADTLEQWCQSKNQSLRPQDIGFSSHTKVWWECEHGHIWCAQVRTRAVLRNGCPVCTHRMVCPGENDLRTWAPELAAEWHPTKNGDLMPQDVLAGSHRKVWWRCAQGHEWQAAVSSRSREGCGCPVCANRVILAGQNDLCTTEPEIAAQWHPTKNGTLRPDQVASGSNRRVWWMCGRGHEWQAVIAQRVQRKSGCPYCGNKRVLPGFNDLATVCPELVPQWHPTLNGALTPAMVTSGSSRRIWWICPEGHVWRTKVNVRTGAGKCGCPVCAGRYRPRKTGDPYFQGTRRELEFTWK